MTLVGLLCLVPFVQPYHPTPISSLFAEWQAFFLLWTAVFIACFHGKRRGEILIPKIGCSAIFLFFFVVISVAFKPPEYAQQVVLPLCYFVSLYGAIQLGFWLRQMDLVKRCTLWVAIYFVVGGAYTVAVQFLQLHWTGFSFLPFITPKMAGYNPYGNIAQTNHLVSYLAIGWASTHYLLARGKIKLRVYLPFSLLLFCGLVMSGQRSGFIYVVSLSFLFWCSALTIHADRILHRSFWISCMPATYLLLSYILPILARVDGAQLVTATQRLGTGWDVRFNMLHIGWSLFKNAPVFGIGWGRLPSYQFLKADVLPTLPANHLHNIVIQLMAETGIFCTVIVLAIFFLWLRTFIKFPSSREKQFVFSVIIVIGLHSLFEYPLWYAYFLLPVGVLVGMFEAEGIRLKVPGFLTDIIIKGASILAMAVLFYSFFEALYVTDLYARRSNFPSPTMRVEEVNEIARMPSNFFLKPYVDFIDSTGREFNSGDLSVNTALNQRLLNSLIDNNVIVRQSIYWAMAGNNKEAEIAFVRMNKIFPGEAPAMLKVINRAALYGKNDHLTAFSIWASHSAESNRSLLKKAS